MDNPKIKVKNHKFGKCLVATSKIAKGEEIARFDGEVFEAKNCNDLPKDYADHVVQFDETKYVESAGVARYANHSCDPNCGVKDFVAIVAMRDIKRGEEITWDYAMTEDSNWRMECQCGSPICRGVIGAFRLLSEDICQKYQGYISGWLVEKYNLR